MIYCYEAKDGLVIERVFPIGKAPKQISSRGKVFKRSFSAENTAVPPTKGWPIECVASGVNAADAQKLRDHFDKAGVPTEVSRNGDPIYRDINHRRKALKCRGLVDRTAYV